MIGRRPRFHLAFPVTDIEQARVFYTTVLGCNVGRESQRWIDFDFQGHQITAHLVDAADHNECNAVDGDKVPTRHFGLILDWEDWQTLASRPEQLDTD
ncbi:MAG: glyoxalase, partial [Gammaproteobacteria bacterium]